ncbi:MAG: hypothetical protein HUJ60_04620, partial [Bacilli bacterium]|nr:hypothetical protein [Bacilli bacterium]
MKKSVTKFSKPLVFLSALMLSSCTGGFIGGDSGDNSGIIAGTTIKIMFHVDSKSAEGIAYKKRVDEFNKQYKDKYKAAATFKARTAG